MKLPTKNPIQFRQVTSIHVHITQRKNAVDFTKGTFTLTHSLHCSALGTAVVVTTSAAQHSVCVNGPWWLPATVTSTVLYWHCCNFSRH